MRKRLMQVFSICMAAALTVTSVINADAAEMTGTNFTQNEGVSETVETPGVEVTEIESLAKNTDMTITVTDTNLGMDKIVAGKVTIDGTEDYELTLDAENNLSVTVPFAAVAARDTFKYQVSITDGINTAVSTETTVVIEEDEDVKVDQTKAPELTITELLPDSTNVNGSDGYEYIEIYNNTENAINLKDYKLCYIYPESEIVTTYWETEEDKMLEAGETLLFWIKNGSNDHLTLKDFNTFYGTSFAEDQAIELFNGASCIIQI